MASPIPVESLRFSGRMSTPTMEKGASFATLPRELRQKILPLSLNLMQGYGNALPAVVLAVQAFPAAYEEALEAYERTNITITYENVAVFEQMSTKEMMKIRHIKIVWAQSRGNQRSGLQEDLTFKAIEAGHLKGGEMVKAPEDISFIGPEEDFNPSFSGHMATMINQLETITVDCMSENRGIDAGSFYIFRSLAKASKCLKRCGLKYPHDSTLLLGTDLYKTNRRERFLGVLEGLNDKFGIVGRLERVGTDYYPEIWFWENDDGTVLNTKNL